MLRKFFLFWKTTELPNNKPIYFFAQFAPIASIFWVGFPLVVILGVGALIFLRHKWDRWFLFLSYMILYMCSVIVFFCPARYRLPVIPILILLTSTGITCTIDEVRLKRFKRPLIYFILCATTAIALYLNPLRPSYPVSQQEASGHRILGNMLALEDKFDGAIEHFDQSLQIDPYSELTYYYLASCLTKQGKTDEAIHNFKKALQINPSHLRTHCDLGKCLMREGKFEESIKHYKKALQINPAYLEVHDNLAIAYLKQGQIQEAINTYKKILEINPDHLKTHINLGGIYLNKGRLDEAIVEFECAVSIKPNSAQAHNSLGVAYGMQNRLDEAITEFKQALTIKPHYAEAHYNLAYGYLSKGLDPSLAADHFYQAGSLHLDEGNIEYALAAYRDLMQTGSEELARKLYMKLSPKLKQKKADTGDLSTMNK